MKRRKQFIGIAAMGAAITTLVMLAACPQPDENEPVPVISISAQPAAATVTAGEITGSLSVAASVTEGAVLAYSGTVTLPRVTKTAP